jgi:hypothetical protein
MFINLINHDNIIKLTLIKDRQREVNQVFGASFIKFLWLAIQSTRHALLLKPIYTYLADCLFY